MPDADDPLWKECLTAEKALGEARDQLRTIKHLDLRHKASRIPGSCKLARAVFAGAAAGRHPPKIGTRVPGVDPNPREACYQPGAI